MGSGKWIMNTLEVFRHLIGKLPNLSNVYYSAKEKRLVLSVEAMEKRLMVSSDPNPTMPRGDEDRLAGSTRSSISMT